MSEDAPELLLCPDEADFRTVLGHFATGVTIITAMDGDEPVGVSANSFTSVSLDPPLVLFCVAKSSTTWPRIHKARRFAANILADHQEEVCQIFATRGIDRFAAVTWHPGVSGSPILDDVLAYVDCVIDAEHEAGDHLIVVGRVLDVAVTSDGGPLLFHRGNYFSFRPD